MREKKSKKNQQDSNIDERREKIFFYLVMVRKRCIEWNLINIFSICDEPRQTNNAIFAFHEANKVKSSKNVSRRTRYMFDCKWRIKAASWSVGLSYVWMRGRQSVFVRQEAIDTRKRRVVSVFLELTYFTISFLSISLPVSAATYLHLHCIHFEVNRYSSKNRIEGNCKSDNRKYIYT